MLVNVHVVEDTEVIIVTKGLEESHYIRVIAFAEYIPFVHHKFLAVLLGEVYLEHLLNGELGPSRLFSGKNNLTISA